MLLVVAAGLLTAAGDCGTRCSGCPNSKSCTSGAPKRTCGWNAATRKCVDLLQDRLNCGAVGRVCATPQGTTSNSCVGGVCKPQCASGYRDCDGNPVNGCEAVNTIERCGTCTTQCTTAIANAEHNDNADIDELKVTEILVDSGPALKRMSPRARGRADRLLKPTSHITITVAEQE